MQNGFGNRFTIDSSPIQFDSDTVTNIFRKRYEFDFSPSASREDIPVAFLSSGTLTANRLISITDKSTSIVANRLQATGSWVTVSGVLSLFVETDRVLITDVYVTNTSIVTPVPLFYKHILSVSNLPRVSSEDLTIQTGVVLSDVAILDGNFNIIQSGSFNVDYATGVVYNNLFNVYEPNTNVYEVYYLRYTLRIGNSIETYTEILNNVRVYTEGTFDDLDEFLQIKQDGRKVYLINSTGGGFDITLPITNTYSYKFTDSNKIGVLQFGDLPVTFPWYPRISNGHFYAAINSATTNYRFSIAEFDSQSWSPEQPYKLITEEPVVVLNESTLKLNLRNIFQDGSKFIDILINDSSDVGLAAFTTNPSNEGTEASNGAIYLKWSFADKIGIRSLDLLGGFVDVEGFSIRDSYKLYASYYIEEFDYEFTDVDLNPLNNSSILQQTLILFLDPDTLSSAKANTVYYLLVNKSGMVVQSSWSSFDNDTQRLTDGDVLYYAGLPAYSQLVSDYSIFLTDYTVSGSGVFLVLGELSVDIDVSPEAIALFDARREGGGIVPSLVDTARTLNNEVDWYWDLGNWDGIPYPANASYFVEIPVNVLSGAGGVFSQQRVKDVVDKHTALGVYAIVKSYGVEARVNDVVPGANSITLTFTVSYPDSPMFDIFYAQDSAGPWVKHNVVPQVVTGDEQTYVVDGLETGVLYYVKIVGGVLQSGTFTPLVSQPIGPFQSGARDFYENSLILSKTFGPRLSDSTELGNRFEVI